MADQKPRLPYQLRDYSLPLPDVVPGWLKRALQAYGSATGQAPPMSAAYAPEEEVGPGVPPSVRAPYGPPAPTMPQSKPLEAVDTSGFSGTLQDFLGPKEETVISDLGDESGEMKLSSPVVSPPTIPRSEQPAEPTAPNGRPLANEYEQKFFEAWEQRKGQMEQELGQARGMRDIAEGLGNIHVPTSGEILLGQKPPDKMVAEDARKKIGELEYQLAPENDPQSPISEQARQIAKSMGFEVPPGTPYSMLAQFLPAAAKTRIANDAIRYEQQQEQTKSVQAREELKYKLIERNATSTSQMYKAEQNESDARSLVAQAASGQLKDLALNQVAIKMVKAAGDTGRLSDQDVDRFAARPGIKGWIDKIHKFAFAEPSEDYRQAVENLGRMMAKFYARSKLKIAMKEARKFMSVHASRGFTFEELMDAQLPEWKQLEPLLTDLDFKGVDVEEGSLMAPQTGGTFDPGSTKVGEETQYGIFEGRVE